MKYKLDQLGKLVYERYVAGVDASQSARWERMSKRQKSVWIGIAQEMVVALDAEVVTE